MIKRTVWVVCLLALCLPLTVVASKKKMAMSSYFVGPDYKIPSVKLTGDLGREDAKFSLSLKLETDSGLELPLVGGDVCQTESKISGGGSWLGWGGDEPEIRHSDNVYFLHCPTAGEYEIEFSFAAKTVEMNNRHGCAFSLIPAIVRKIELTSYTKDCELSVDGALDLIKKEDGGKAKFTAVLPPEGVFRAAWWSHIDQIKAELVTSAAERAIYRVMPGTVKLDAVINYRVIQGKLNSLELAVSSDLNILNVIGKNIQDWRVVDDNGKRGLTVKLSGEFEDNYRLGIQAEKILANFPCGFDLPTIVPLNTMRVDGMLAFGSNQAVKLIIDKTSGLSQVDNQSFGMDSVLEVRPPSRSLYTYHFSSGQYAMRARADNVIPSFSANNCQYTVFFKDEDMTVKALCELEVKDAPLRELVMEYDGGLTVNRVEGASVVGNDYEIFKRDGKRCLRIPFADALGKTVFTVHFERSTRGSREIELPRLVIDGVKSARGFLSLAADRGLTLTPEGMEELRQVHTGSLPIRVTGLQYAYRFKNQDWSGKVKVKREKSAIVSEVFHLLSVGDGSAYGSSIFTYHISGAPLDRLVLSVDSSFKNLEFTGRDIVDWTRLDDADGRGRWAVNFRGKTLGDYTLLATYELGMGERGGELALGGIATVGGESENGFMVLSSRRNLKTTVNKPSEGVHRIEVAELPAEYRQLVVNPILAVYRSGLSGGWVEVGVSAYNSEELLGVVVDHTEADTVMDSNGEARTEVEYRVKNSSRQFLELSLPKGADLWSVLVDGARERLSLDDGKVLIPLPRREDIKTPIPVSLSFAQKFSPLDGDGRVELALPTLDSESMFTKWRIKVPEKCAIEDVAGNMTLGIETPVRGLSGLARKCWRWLVREATTPLPLAWILALLGGVVLAWSWGGGRWRIPATGLGLILLSLAGIGVLLSAKNLFPAVSEPPPFRFNSIELSSLFSLPGESLNAGLSIVNLEAATAWTMLGTGGCLAGAMFSLLLACRVKWRLTKVLLTALGCMLILCGGSQWWWFITVGGFALSIILPGFIVLALWTLVFRRAKSRRLKAALMLTLVVLAGMNAEARRVRQRPNIGSHTPGIRVLQADFKVKAGEKSVNVKGLFKFESKVSRGSFTLLRPPAVVTSEPPEDDDFNLVRDGESYRLEIERDGEFEYEIDFLVPFEKTGDRRTFQLAVPPCLSDTVEIECAIPDFEVLAPDAVIWRQKFDGNLCHAEGVFPPNSMACFIMSPRTRDVEKEKARFFANIETEVLFNPGLVETKNKITLRVAQGEIAAFSMSVPENMTVTSVETEHLGAWRLDTDKRCLDIMLTKSRHGGFDVRVDTQIANLTAPYQTSVSLPSVIGAERQHGVVGCFVAPSVMLKIDEAKGLNRINNSDFRADTKLGAAELKKSFRHHGGAASLSVDVTAIDPELRLNENCRVAFEEERVAISSELEFEILKAGVFAIEAVLPAGFEIDRLAGDRIQHWDDLEENGRTKLVIHFSERVLGKTSLKLDISRPGSVVNEQEMLIPRIEFPRVKRQSGELLVLIEQGVRMRVLKRSGLEVKAAAGSSSRIGVKQRFAILRPDWSLAVLFEVAEPWVQVDAIDRATVKSGFIEREVKLDYHIDNAGIKVFDLRMPPATETPEIIGEDINAITNPEPGLWRVALHQKKLGSYRLRLLFRQPRPKGDMVILEPVTADGVGLQKGYLVVFAGDALQVKVTKLSGDITKFDPRKIPGQNRVDNAAAAVACLRTVGAACRAELEVKRHQAATVLGAQVKQLELDSVVSPEGMLITKVEAMIDNNDLNYLRVKLPMGGDGAPGAVWSVFVDNHPVDSASENGELLIPLKQNNAGVNHQKVEFIYSTGTPDKWRPSEQSLAGPEFALPLRDVTWTLCLPSGFDYYDFDGTMNHIDDSFIAVASRGLNEYDRYNRDLVSEDISQAKTWFAKGQRLASAGKVDDAMNAYQNALNLSDNDYALNQDIAGRQLEIQRTQTISALSKRRGKNRRNLQNASVAQQGIPVNDFAAAPPELGSRELGNKIADRISLQQRVASSAPHPLRVTMPEVGAVIHFQRGLQIKPYAPMTVSFKAAPKTLEWRDGAKWSLTAALAAGFAILTLLGFAAFGRRRKGLEY